MVVCSLRHDCWDEDGGMIVGMRIDSYHLPTHLSTACLPDTTWIPACFPSPSVSLQHAVPSACQKSVVYNNIL